MDHKPDVQVKVKPGTDVKALGKAYDLLASYILKRNPTVTGKNQEVIDDSSSLRPSIK